MFSSSLISACPKVSLLLPSLPFFSLSPIDLLIGGGGGGGNGSHDHQIERECVTSDGDIGAADDAATAAVFALQARLNEFECVCVCMSFCLDSITHLPTLARFSRSF